MTTPVTSLREVNADRVSDDERARAMYSTVRDLISQSYTYWQKDGVLDNHGGFGVVVRIVPESEVESLRGGVNDANALFDFAYNQGSSFGFFYRALCKQHAVVRTDQNTADLTENEFENVVTNADMDGDNPQLGEYPHAGGVVLKGDGYVVYVSTSGFSGRQDRIVSTLVGEVILDKLAVQDAANKSKDSAANAEA